MTDSIYKVTGVQQVGLALAKLARLVADLTPGFDAIGRSVVADARLRSPRKTGQLANSIGLDRGPTYASIHAGGGSVVYAGVQNYGWRRRHIPATQFLTLAADTKADPAAAELAKQIQKRIRESGL